MHADVDDRHAGGMDGPLELLPRVYAQFLLLREEGLPDATIAERLGVPVESLPLLARLAHAKLARLESAPDDVAAPPAGEPSGPPGTQPSAT